MDAESGCRRQACPDRKADRDEGRRVRPPDRRPRRIRPSRHRGLHDRPPSAVAARQGAGGGGRDRPHPACRCPFQL